MNEHLGHCEYCDKEHDLRIACFEYASTKSYITKELWDDCFYIRHRLKELINAITN